jgi:hypothetical protein
VIKKKKINTYKIQNTPIGVSVTASQFSVDVNLFFFNFFLGWGWVWQVNALKKKTMDSTT